MDFFCYCDKMAVSRYLQQKVVLNEIKICNKNKNIKHYSNHNHVINTPMCYELHNLGMMVLRLLRPALRIDNCNWNTMTCKVMIIYLLNEFSVQLRDAAIRRPLLLNNHSTAR